MGRPKFFLPFGPEPMGVRVVRLIRQAVDTIVLVAGADQELPEFPWDVTIVRDRYPDRGPMEGMAVGMRAIAGRAEAAFISGCDVPLIRPDFIRRMFELSAGHDIAVPFVGGFYEPLAAVYRTSLLPRIEAELTPEGVPPLVLYDQVRTRKVTADELADIDPKLASLANVNDPAGYRETLSLAGLGQPRTELA